jgi:NAD(P)-dependent dehydrogenase (short-subunit alcohol dehydrogenase family)
MDGRIALVTGGARGIGRGVVERLRRDGWTVSFADRLAADDPGLIAADLSRPEDCRRVVEEVGSRQPDPGRWHDPQDDLCGVA